MLNCLLFFEVYQSDPGIARKLQLAQIIFGIADQCQQKDMTKRTERKHLVLQPID